MVVVSDLDTGSHTWVSNTTDDVPSFDLVCHLYECFLRGVMSATAETQLFSVSWYNTRN